MKTFIMGLLASISLQTAHASTLDCVSPTDFGQPAKRFTKEFEGPSVKLALDPAFGYTIEASAFAGQVAVIASQAGVRLSSTGANQANLRVEADGFVTEYNCSLQ